MRHISKINFFTVRYIWFKSLWQSVAPGPRAWQGAGLGVLAAAAAILIILSYQDLVGIAAPNPYALLELVLMAVVGIILGGLAVVLFNVFQVVPTFYRWALITGIVIITRGFPFFLMPGSEIVILFIIVTSSLTGAGGWVVARGGLKDITPLKRLIAIGGLSLGVISIFSGLVWLLDDGSTPEALPNAALLANAKVKPLDLPDPSLPGPYQVLTLTYGSGTDRHRPEYGKDVKFITQPVDGSPFVDGWNGLVGWARSGYWGFDTKQLPLNARVWYPDGTGPFPLVLVVHGNHKMEEFSDSGFDYLGELLASRGFILVSVNENFLNPELSIWRRFKSDLHQETDARGWLLLEHLKLWRNWNKTTSHPFFQKVDLNNIALIGHSRGGEAVTIAAAFNQLSHYPDNAKIVFNYNFNIRSIVSIAPTDGQYRPANRSIWLENVNYFVLQGAHDGDIISFEGLRQYERVRFTDGISRFKAGLYIHGANHNQFNTTWGRKDNSVLLSELFNIRQIMPAAVQQQVTKVFISAFLEATLRGQADYILLFRDYRTAANWLPNTIYLQQYADSTYQFVSTYEEDIDLNTTTLPGGKQNGENLTTWRERVVPLKLGTHNTSAVYLDWDSQSNIDTPIYAITLPPQGLTTTKESVLTFSLADRNGPYINKRQNQVREPIDLTIEVVDNSGITARLPLGSVSLLQPKIEVQLTKATFIEDFAHSEIIFQSFEFPLSAFKAANPQLDMTNLKMIRFVFDRTPAGEIALDNVGFGKR